MLLAGCGFEHGAAGRLVDGALDDDAPQVADAPRAADARIDTMIDARIAPFCDSADTSLVACYEFEGNANDASANMLNATTSNVGYAIGRVGMAMRFGATSAAEVADSSAFDVSAVTIEAWINPSQMPPGSGRMGIVDMNGQWGFFLHPNGQLRCSASVTITVNANVPTNQWTHVACTYDGTTATIYVNGIAATPTGTGGALSTASTSGLSIAADNPAGSGSRLIGLIDQLRLMSRARTANEICVDADACSVP